MLFNSVDFLLFFPIVVLLYWVVPKKLRYIWLLVASYYFYMGWNSQYALLIATSTAITYFCGIGISAMRNQEGREIALVENGRLIEYYIDEEETTRKEGNIYVGVVKDIIKGMQAAFVNIGTQKNSFIHVKDIIPQVDEKIEKTEEPKIKNVVKPKQKVLVQVQKDSNDKKGARTTTHIKLTGKYIILLPQTTIVTISQKIQDETEKNRLIDIVKKNIPENMGAIIRTDATKKSENVIINDLQNLQKQWEKIYKNYEKAECKPQLLYKSPSIVEKIILDLPLEKIESIVVNDKEDYNEIKQVINSQIDLKIEENVDLINKYELENQIEKSKQRKVWLNCGGFITIDPTEALVAIDVNSGKYTGKSTLEETVYKVNYEATLEIAKQLRLRDIGGIIIIDYIDMKNQEHKEKIKQLLKETLKQDRAKTQVEGFTKLNLMELTRKHICAHNS